MKIKHLLLFVLVLSATKVWAQEATPTGGIEGQVVTRVGRAPITGIKVTLEPGGLVRYTEKGGVYDFGTLPAGQYTLKFEGTEFEDTEVTVRVAETKRNVVVPMISTVDIGGLNDLDIVDFDMEGGDDIQ
jgi:hypothetical protein